MENIFLSDAAYEKLASQTEDLLAEVDSIPDSTVKDDIHLLLQNLDLLHREALTRLFKEIIINHPDLQTKMEGDKAVRLLFSLYDLFHSEFHYQISAQDDHTTQKDAGKYPLWIPIGNVAELRKNATYKYTDEGENILICKTEDSVYAVKNSCSNTMLPLDGAAIDKGYLICPWHGCAYRLFDGVMETNPLQKISKYPVEVDADGEIRLGLNM